MPHVDRGNTMLRLIRRTKTASIVVTRAWSTQRRNRIRTHLAFTNCRAPKLMVHVSKLLYSWRQA